MKTLKKIFKIFTTLLLFFGCQKNYSQQKNIEKDIKIDQLLADKRKVNAAITITDKFKIQIFYGNLDDSKKNLTLFRKKFTSLDATIVFNNPSYKVWVGSFRTKIEAEKALIIIKKKYPSAVIIEANKK